MTVKNNSSDLIESIKKSASFGVDEQVITMLCSLGGFANMQKKALEHSFIIIAFASSIPDVFSYTRSVLTSNKISNLSIPNNQSTLSTKELIDKNVSLETIKNASVPAISIFLIEFIVSILVGLPLFLSNNTRQGILLSSLVGIIILFLTEIYIQNSTLKDASITTIFAIIAISISYIIGKLVKLNNSHSKTNKKHRIPLYRKIHLL